MFLISLFDYIYNKYQDIKYLFWDCQFGRQERLINCCFWRRADEKLTPETAYDQYENHFKYGMHKDWCLYFPFGRKSCNYCNGTDFHQFYSDDEFEKLDNIREGVKDLGVALHHECHDSLELTELRLLGAKDKEYIFCWDDITKKENLEEKSRLINFLRNRIYLELDENVEIIKNEDCKKIKIGSYELIIENGTIVKLQNSEKTFFKFTALEVENKINVYIKAENDDVELFRRHYHELSCLKNSLLDEINILEKEKATQLSLGIFWLSIVLTIIITIWTSKDLSASIQFGLIFSYFFGFILILFYLSNAIKLNEAKDAMYICLGVDVDRRKQFGKEFRYIDVGDRPS